MAEDVELEVRELATNQAHLAKAVEEVRKDRKDGDARLYGKVEVFAGATEDALRAGVRRFTAIEERLTLLEANSLSFAPMVVWLKEHWWKLAIGLVVADRLELITIKWL